MQVSYPQYLRLVALQEKVVKLDKLIKALQARYTLEELEQLPQYARLQTLHQSLLPLLPNNGQLPENEEDNITVFFTDLSLADVRTSQHKYLPKLVSFSSCQRNLIKTFQIDGMIALITKMHLIFS